MNAAKPRKFARACAGVPAWLLAGILAAAEPTGAEKTPGSLLTALESKGNLFQTEIDSLVTTIGETQGFGDLHKNLKIRPQSLQAKSGAGQVLGFEYDYHKSVANRPVDPAAADPLWVSLRLDLKGTVAADAPENPANLLESGLSLHLFRSIGGVQPAADPVALQRWVMRLAQDPDFLRQKGAAYQALARELAAHFSTQYLWDLKARASYESDQQLRNRQWAYGAELLWQMRDWRPRSETGWLNLPDYPFAVTRWLFEGGDFAPSGRTLPSLAVGVDQIDPQQDAERLKVDPRKDRYTRWRAEVAFKTRLLRWEGAPLYVEAAYRCFQEQGAAAAIGAARLDRFNYFAAKIDLPGRFFVSYARGKLPFDRKSDEVFGLGWSLHDQNSDKP
jgi:hypothetical protein